MSDEEKHVEASKADSNTEPATQPGQLGMQTRHLPYLSAGRANRLQSLLGPIGMHAKLKKEDQDKVLDLYFPEAIRNVMPADQQSILPFKFSLQQAETELNNAFVASYNVLKETTIFGPKSALYAKAKKLGGAGGSTFVPFETQQRQNVPSDTSLDSMIRDGVEESATAKVKGIKEAAEAVKLFRLTVMQVALSLLLNPLPAPEWSAARRKVFVFPMTVTKSTINPLIRSFESMASQVGTEDNLTIQKLRTALEVVCEVRSRVPQALGRLSTLMREPNDNLRTWNRNVINAAKVLISKLNADQVKKEYPNAETTFPRVLPFILMTHQVSKSERAFMKKLVEDKNTEGRRADAGFSFEPWRDEEAWEELILGFRGASFESLKVPTKADRKEIADTIPIMPDEAAKRRKTEFGKQSTAQSATQSATVQPAAPKAAGRQNLGQSYSQSVGSKKQVVLSVAELLDCKKIIDNAQQPTKRADGSIAQDVSPPCAICKKYFPSIRTASTNKPLCNGHATYKCRMVQLNSNGKAFQSKKRTRISKKNQQP